MKKAVGRILTLAALLCCTGAVSAAAAGLSVDSYSIYGADGTGSEQKPAIGAGDNYIVPRIVNNTPDAQKLMLAAAVYNKDGSLCRISGYTNTEIAAETELYPEIKAEFTEDDAEKTLKVFVWDENQKPVSSAQPCVFTAVVGAKTYDEVKPELISMPSMFSDNMVIQRDQEARLWGRTGADKIRAFAVNSLTGEKLAGSEAETDVSGANNDWMLSLGSHEYDGRAYEIVIEAEKDGKLTARKTIDNIVFGDVYLCSGQSNMEYEMLYNGWTDCHADLFEYYERAKNEDGSEVRDEKGSITPINYKYSTKLINSNVRIVENMNSDKVEEYYSTDTDGWHTAEAKTLEHFSATATYFGFALEEENKVPIGLVQSAIGGSGIENWAISPTKDKDGSILFNGNHGILFRRQISGYTHGPAGLSGVIWYQGCADAEGTKKDSAGNIMTMDVYTKTMEQMVNDWREKFSQPELPFMYVQLAAFRGSDYSRMREAQLNYRTGKNTNNGIPSNVGMAVITDNADGISDVHPRNKKEVGRRLALIADRLVYHKDITAEGPIFKDAVVDKENGTITVSFEEGTTGTGLVIDGEALKGMKISTAARRVWVEPEYELSQDGRSIILRAPEGSLATYPSYVQYGFYSLPTDANLKNSAGLPASPFRNYDDDTPTIPDPIEASEIKAYDLSPEGVTLSWGADAESSDAAYYEVIRDNEVIAEVGSVPVRDRTAESGKTYSYELKLYSADGRLLDESGKLSLNVPEDTAYAIKVNENGEIISDGIAAVESLTAANAPLDGSGSIVLSPKGTISIDIPSSLSEKLGGKIKLTYTYNAETVENTIDIKDAAGNILNGEFIGANGSQIGYWKRVTVPAQNMTYDDTAGSAELTINNTSGKAVYIKDITVSPAYDGERAAVKASQTDSNTIELKYMHWFPKAQIEGSKTKGINTFKWTTSSWTNMWINPSYIPNGTSIEATFITTYYDTPNSSTAAVYSPAIGYMAEKSAQTGEWVTNVLNNDSFVNTSPTKPAAYNDSYAAQISNASMDAEAAEIELVNSKASIPAELEMLGGTVHRTMLDYERASGINMVINTATGNAKYIRLGGGTELKLRPSERYIPQTDNSITVDIAYISQSGAELAYTDVNGETRKLTLDAAGSEESPAAKTVHIKDYANGGGLSLRAGNAELDLVRIRITNDELAYSEIVPAAAVDTTPMPEAKLEIEKDSIEADEDTIALKWTQIPGAAYYKVERSLGGVTEMVSDNITATSYIDKGTADRGENGPAEFNYEIKVSAGDERYSICDETNQKAAVAGAGSTVRFYEPYAGLPLIAGCEYEYKVTAYTADGAAAAVSDTKKLSADAKKNTAAAVFSGDPSTELNGYGMTAANLPADGIEGGSRDNASCWILTQHNAELALRLNDDSGLIGTEKKNYLVKYTYLDNHPSRWSAVKLSRDNNYGYIDMLSGNKAANHWVTREIVYTGVNDHLLSSGGNASDIVFKGYFAGENPGLALHSIEITLLEEPVIETHDIEVMQDEDTTTDSQVGMKWVYTGDTPEEVKYYRVSRIANGVTEFTTEGEVSDTKYVDKGSAQRPAYGPYETDYDKKTGESYNIADMNNTKARLSDAGTTTRFYDPYEGIALVSGGSYSYIVRGYNASGEVIAESALTTLKTEERENTASIVFDGTPKDGFEGYNMSVSSVTNMEVGTYNENLIGWRFVSGCNENDSNLGLLLDDASGLTNSDEDEGYLIKVTWGDRFWNANGTARLNLQRTANPEYDQSNFNNRSNYIYTDAGSGADAGKWITREIAYYGRNAHKLLANGAAADIVINSWFGGKYTRFYIRSIEITKWDGPEERPFTVNMPSMFTDNMMLQRDADINIWGRIDGAPKEAGKQLETTVTAVLRDEDGAVAAQGIAAASDSQFADWTMTLDNTVGYEEGKTYTLEVSAESGGKASETVTINNIIFGDVYLCAGQSNMRYGPEYAAWTDYRADIDAGEFDNSSIRIISNENTTVSDFWETDTTGWREASAESIYDLGFSATGAYFGKHLYEENGNVPVGLISSAVGGAGIGTFLVDPVKDETGNTIYTGNSILYKRLIYPYTNWYNDAGGMSLSGIIWYQGEADANSTGLSRPAYTKCMEQMVKDYRSAFGNEQLPFMYVQLAAFDNPSGEYTEMREAQLNYMLGINTNDGVPENVGMAVITDNTDNIKDIHPRNKNEVGRRLSLWALKLVYGRDDFEYTGPIFDRAEPTGDGGLEISFKDGSVMNGLELKDGQLVGMKIAGEDKSFEVPDSWELSEDGKSLIVRSSLISDPEYVEYGYYKLPTDATIFNADGLPASAFRNYQ